MITIEKLKDDYLKVKHGVDLYELIKITIRLAKYSRSKKPKTSLLQKSKMMVKLTIKAFLIFVMFPIVVLLSYLTNINCKHEIYNIIKDVYDEKYVELIK